MQLDTLTIVGVGLIGGSIGMAARSRGIARRVVGVGRKADALRRARDLGAIDDFALDLSEGVREAELVVFCTPVDRIAEQVCTAAQACRPGALLTDAGSTKAAIVHAVEGRLPAGVHFVGSHPLAGSEKKGHEHGRPDLFDGRLTVVTPTPRTDPKAVERTVAFWKAFGSRIQLLDPEGHDRALALTSHLPHLLAAALAGVLPAEWRPFTATGFRDTTRIAAGDPGLWAAIFSQNREAVGEALDRLTERLTEYRQALTADDGESLIRLLTQAKQVRDALGS